MATAVPLATPLMLFPAFPVPLSRSTTTVGAVPPVSKTKPLGAFKMIVPVPTSPLTFSKYSGPVKFVNAAPVASAEMALPPVAAVYWMVPPTVMVGLVLAVLPGSVTSLAVTVWDPAVLKVTLNVWVPATSTELVGKVAAESVEVMAAVSVTVLARFQLASTALTVTLNGPATFWLIGVPVLPEAVPGAADSPGASSCSLVNAPTLTAIDGLVLAVIPAWVRGRSEIRCARQGQVGESSPCHHHAGDT